MRKALVILVALAFAAPLYADVDFGPAVNNLDGTCTIPWSSNDLPIVAMGLDVDVLVGPDEIGGVAVDSFFDIFMDAAYDLEPTPGYNYGDGTPIADQDAAGEIALPSANFCISMGGLGGAAAPLNDPCTSGTITLTADGTKTASGTLDENSLRGGVIDEDGNQVTTNLPIPFTITDLPSDCVKSDAPFYDEWVGITSGGYWSKPDCWCYKRNCRGDADGIKPTLYRVTTDDLAILVASFSKADKKLTQVTICADFDHIKPTLYRVTTDDLAILVNAF